MCPLLSMQIGGGGHPLPEAALSAQPRADDVFHRRRRLVSTHCGLRCALVLTDRSLRLPFAALHALPPVCSCTLAQPFIVLFVIRAAPRLKDAKLSDSRLREVYVQVRAVCSAFWPVLVLARRVSRCAAGACAPIWAHASR